jgi:predicted phage tail protein
MSSATSQPLRTIRLLGDLGRRFGREHRLAVATPAEAIRALCVVRPGFRQYVESRERWFKVLVRKAPVADFERELHLQHGPDAGFTIAPVIAGAKSKFFQIILGVALIAFAVVNPFGLAALSITGTTVGALAVGVGVSLVIGGVAQLLAPTPEYTEPVENQPSYLFNGPVQTTQVGFPVPVGYGELIVGGARISTGIWSEDIPV